MRTPPNDLSMLAAWRLQQLGLPTEPVEKHYDLVVIGGGYSGNGAALSAARMGCKVALVQNRPVLGGNGSSEVRVWSMGLIRRGPFPRVGEIVEEFCDHATKSPGLYEEFEDERKEQIVRAEPNLELFLNHHAHRVTTDGSRIVAIEAFHTKTSERVRFIAPLFVDCTGHGTIGYLAKADWAMNPDGRMGMSNMWAWAEGTTARRISRNAMGAATWRWPIFLTLAITTGNGFGKAGLIRIPSKERKRFAIGICELYLARSTP